MPSVATSARLLSRYSDLFGIVALLPLISHVKFAHILEAKEETDAQAEEEAEAKDRSKKPATAPEEERGYLPPVWALLLLLLSELLGAAALFDPSDKKVRRAAGEALRAQRRSQGAGLEKTLQAVEALLRDEDVYQLIRSVGLICGCGSLLVSALAGLDRLPGLGSRSPLGPGAAALHGLRHFLRAVLRPRLLGFAALFVLLAFGHHTALVNVARKPGASELLQALPALLRAMGLTGAAFSPSSEVLPIFAAFSCCAALAREAHVLVYERIAVSDLLKGGLFGAKAGHLGPRSAMAMDLWSVLMLLPVALSKRRFLLILPVLVMPCVWLACDRPVPGFIEQYADLIVGRMVFCSAVMTLFVFFLGGVQTMTILVLLMQVLVRIHGLEKLKY